jgi:hypothetical protein
MRQTSSTFPRRLPAVLGPALICLGLLSLVLWLVVSTADRPGAALAAGGAGTAQATPTLVHTYAAVVLDWTTKSEVNTAGFNLYRADSSTGPFVQINRELIPSANDPIAGGHYTYTDTAAVAGQTYFYQLEDVELSGTRTRHDAISITAGTAPLTIGGIDATLALFGLVVVTAVTGLGLVLWRFHRR